MVDIVVIAHNLRSAENVGSIIRTSEGMAVSAVYLSGYSPYPKTVNDTRIPHLATKQNKQIAKASLGAEKLIPIYHFDDVEYLIRKLKNDGYSVVALEQAKDSSEIKSFSPSDKIAVIVGREVDGIEKEILKEVDEIIEIPMLGKKESFNVSVALAVALYHIRYMV